jgi:hypothetical protein
MVHMNYTIKSMHISMIRSGDTIEHDGVMRTVSGSDIKNGFMGKTIFGDSYNLGNKLVRVVIFNKPT